MRQQSADALFDLVERMVAETRGVPTDAVEVRPTDRLDRDLGFDSLGRLELVRRVEGAFGASLPEGSIARVETMSDLAAALEQAGPSRTPHTERRKRDGGAAVIAVPEAAATLVDVLDWHVERHPDRAYLHLYEDPDAAVDLSFGEMGRTAARVAAGLADRGLEKGGAVALLLPTGRDYFSAFFGTILAGGVAVPLYPPVRMSQLEDHLARQVRILQNAGVTAIVTFDEAKTVARVLRSRVPSLRHVVTVADLVESGTALPRPALAGDDVAFLQYTSGSTGTPKGVVLTHANLLANVRAMVQGIDANSRDVFVSWLPLYHDMGLIGACLATLYAAVPVALMSPLAFLSRPERWLWAVHRHGGSISAAPNFAYELCASRIDEERLRGLDLSTWRAALNGAEPVSPRTIERFTARFAAYGFKPEAMCPVYGLAECAVGLTFPRPWSAMHVVDRVDRDEFARTGRAVPAAKPDERSIAFVGCGQPLEGHEVRIVDETGREVGERQQGRLEFRGPSATGGYYRNEEATRRLRRGDWLDSGDQAYVAGGEVFLTGRQKDIIIRGGRNVYPQEIEEVVGEVEGVRRGCVAVFGSPDPASGTERVIVLAETKYTDPDAVEDLRSRIMDAACVALGGPPDAVVLSGPRVVPKTSSGKVRRSAAREMYESGDLGKRASSATWQLARLWLAGQLDRVRVLRRTTGEYAHAAWVWFVVIVLAAPGWTLAFALPRFAWRWAALRATCRAALRLAGIRVRAEGLARLPRDRQVVVVANHTSYMDPLVLVACLPGRYRFVAKRELEDSWFGRTFFRRIGILFVERFEAERAAEDARKVLAAAGDGTSLAVFPEGTFRRSPGLLPFRTGAFATAAEAGLPVVPVTIHGARSILRGDEWFPRRGSIEIAIGEALHADGRDWSAAVALRDRAREAILGGCGEPDVARVPTTV